MGARPDVFGEFHNGPFISWAQVLTGIQGQEGGSWWLMELLGGSKNSKMKEATLSCWEFCGRANSYPQSVVFPKKKKGKSSPDFLYLWGPVPTFHFLDLSSDWNPGRGGRIVVADGAAAWE